MKEKKIPTARLLIIFSWLILFLGVTGGCCLILSGFRQVHALLSGVFVLLGGLVLAALIRMFGNIGQMVFDMQKNLFELADRTREVSGRMAEVKDISENIKSVLEHISCDSRETAENIHEIKGFFERIESKLDLKK